MWNFHENYIGIAEQALVFLRLSLQFLLIYVHTFLLLKYMNRSFQSWSRFHIEYLYLIPYSLFSRHQLNHKKENFGIFSISIEAPTFSAPAIKLFFRNIRVMRCFSIQLIDQIILHHIAFHLYDQLPLHSTGFVHLDYTHAQYKMHLNHLLYR